MNKLKFWSSFLLGVALVGASVTAGVIVTNQINNEVIEQVKIDSKQEGYEEGRREVLSSVDGYVIEIENLQAKIAVYETEKEEYENTILDLQNQNKLDLQTITDLQKNNSVLQQQKAELLTSNTNKDEQILELENQITVNNEEMEKLNTDIADRDSKIVILNGQIADKNSQISQLETDKVSLQNEIERLNQLLSAYEKYENQSFTVTYYVDNKLFDTQVVNMGETTIQSLTPENTERYTFLGWQVDGIDIDFTSYTFNKNTRIDAKLNYNIYTINFVSNGSLISTQQIYGGDTITPPTIEYDVELEDFVGWSLSTENVEIIDFENFSIVSNYTFHAIFESVYTSIQKFDSSNILTEYSVANAYDLQTLQTLVANGNTFVGVTIYQVKDIDLQTISNWIPIGDHNNTFQGSFNGLNHYIDNLTFNNSFPSFVEVSGYYYGYFGLFGFVKGDSTVARSVIENIKFRNVDIVILNDSYTSDSYKRYAGVLCGRVAVADIKNVVFESGTFKSEVSNSMLCGPVGLLGNAYTIDNCISYIDFNVTSNNSVCLFAKNTTGTTSYKYCTNNINYGDVNNAQVVYSLSLNSDTESYGCENYGIFTNCKTIYGIQSYEGETT